ncbi:MAG: cysteine hydrolase family protein [Thermoanaerobaculia bacterium]
MKKTALILIDIQQAFDDPRWGPRNNPDAERNAARLLDAWRRAGRPVFHVQHMSAEPDSPLRPGLPGNAIKEEVQPLDGEPLLHKSVNSAFIGTDLEQRLRAGGVDEIVTVGLTTNHCVSTTARMAGNLGFRTFVVSDATATFETTSPAGHRYTAEEMHDMGLAELSGEFATIVTTEELLARLEDA